MRSANPSVINARTLGQRHRGPARGAGNRLYGAFPAEEFDVARGDIEIVFCRMNVNQQLRIKSPTRLPAVIAQHGLCRPPFLNG